MKTRIFLLSVSVLLAASLIYRYYSARPFIAFASYGGIYGRVFEYGRTLIYGTSYSKLYFLDTNGMRTETLDLNSGTATPRIMAGRILYVMSGDTVWAVDYPTRSVLWRFSVPRQYEVDSIRLTGGTLLVGGMDGTLYALRARDGRLRWMHEVKKTAMLSRMTAGTAPAYFGSVIGVGNAVYMADRNGALSALRVSDGRVLWTYDAGSLITAGPDFYGNELFFGTKDGRTVSVDRRTGRTLWTAKERSPVVSADVTSSWWVSRNPVVFTLANIAESVRSLLGIGGIAYFEVHEDGTVIRRDGMTGHAVWKTPAFGAGVNALSRWFDRGFVTTEGGKVAMLSLINGDVLWKRGGFGSVRQQAVAVQWFAPVSVVRPFLPVRWIFGDMNGVVRSLDGKTGRTVWSFQAMGPIYSRPTVSGGMLRIGTADGLLYQLKARTGQPDIPALAGTFAVVRTELPVGADRISEFSVSSPLAFDNPWWEAQVEARFTHESGMSVTVPGFYYDGNIWKVRFNPPKKGIWKWNISFLPYGKRFTREGVFTARTDTTATYLAVGKDNPKRLTLDGTTIFNGLGLGDTLYDGNRNGTPLDDWALGDSAPFVATGSGGIAVRYKSDRIRSLADYIAAYGPRGAGFNMFRWSILNGSGALWRDLGFPMVYSVRDGKVGDELVTKLRSGGFHVWLTMFGFDVPFQSSLDEAEKSLLTSYVRYVVARYGAFTDVWELANEDTLPPRVISFLTEAIRTYDIYRHPISTSFEEPERDDIDIIDPHWYATEDVRASDSETASRIRTFDSYDKPVVFGEQGNKERNWDSTSALRMRVRAWTSFFTGGILMFWNRSDAKGTGYSRIPNANQYIGAEERGYMRILQDRTRGIPLDSTRVGYDVSRYGVRGYGVQSARGINAYFYHYENQEEAVSVPLIVTLPRSGTVEWIDPASGRSLREDRCGVGTCTAWSPSFIQDVAVTIRYE